MNKYINSLREIAELKGLWESVFLAVPLKLLSAVKCLNRLTCCYVVWGIIKCDGVKLLSVTRWLVTLLIVTWNVFTFDHCALTIPTRSHTPRKYQPRFALLCSPEIPRNPTTSARNFHFPFFTLIQWAVTPRNEAFVVLTDQPSAVVETKPGADCETWG